jgi:hypothetical protein
MNPDVLPILALDRHAELLRQAAQRRRAAQVSRRPHSRGPGRRSRFLPL